MVRFLLIVVSSLLAGLIAGVLMTIVQIFTTIPLIAEAEVYERSAAALPAPKAALAAGHHGADSEPDDGLERTFYTGVSTVLAGIGYALLVGVALSRLKLSGWRQGLILGAAGFIVFQLAPALGIPPQPPGVSEADLAARQLWWFGTVAATGAGLGCWYRARTQSKWIWIPAGAVLLAAPHVIGAPQVPQGQSAVPQFLAQQFAIVALVTMAVFWLVLGSIEGLIFSRLSRR